MARLEMGEGLWVPSVAEVQMLFFPAQQAGHAATSAASTGTSTAGTVTTDAATATATANANADDSGQRPVDSADS